MSITEILEQYNIEQLKEYIGQLHLMTPSANTKEAIVRELAAYLLRPNVMMERLSVVSQEDVDLFLAVLEDEIEIDDDNAEGAVRLSELDYVAITEDGMIIAPDDVKEAFLEVDLSDFLEMRESNYWLRCCIGVLCTIYGAAPREILYKLFCTRRGKSPSFEDFWALYRRLPQDLNPCIDDGETIFERFFAVDPSCMDKVRTQDPEMFYIPEREEIEEYAKNFCLIRDENYQGLFDFFKERTDEFDALHAVADIYNRFAMGDDFADFPDFIADWGIKLNNEVETKKLLDLVVGAYYNTRMQEYQGYTKKEWIKLHGGDTADIGTVIVAETEDMADTLSQYEDILTKCGFVVDYTTYATEISSMVYPEGLDGDGAVLNTRKIYPKDICPCGSGKEYRFCCMRVDQND
ncbi:MAG: SEC-C domain-containing protein [Lachnospiraceae bacterium]|nr:SEC-C domain-containing protein [Lachnospiraceae bacterium]